MRLLFAIFFLIYVHSLSAQDILINEIISSNKQINTDEDGHFSDWIELHNTGTDTVSMEGFGLSDNQGNPFKWVFGNHIIAPDSFLLVWASGKNRNEPGMPLHTNFSIGASGEEILLTYPGGTLADFVLPIQLPSDVSFGRSEQGNTWMYFDVPSPGYANTGIGYAGIVSDPIFSHASGSFTSPFLLAISAEEDAEVYFTLDGTVPYQDNGIPFTEAIEISQSSNLSARAIRAEYIPSEIRSIQFTFLGPGMQNFSSDLPLIIIKQDSLNPINSEERVEASATFIDVDSEGRSQLVGDEIIHSRIATNYRGSTSQIYPKKMMALRLIDETGENRDASLFGMPADNNWILYAPFADKTMMRNVLAYGLSESMGHYAPRTRFAEVFTHEGSGPLTYDHYHGVYVLVERIKWGSDRVDITKLTLSDVAEPDITGGYIFKIDRHNTGEEGFWNEQGKQFVFVRPDETEITPEQYAYISQYMTDVESSIFSESFDDPELGYQAFIDVDSFIDYFLITELFKEIDGYRLSAFMHKDRGGKLVMGPLWDFNLSAGNADYLNGWIPEGWQYQEVIDQGCAIWYEKLLQDHHFAEQVSTRWKILRQEIFSDHQLTDLIYSTKARLNESQERNYEKWPVLGVHLWPNWFVGNTYDEEVDWMHAWFMERTVWMDSQLGSSPIDPVYFWHFNDTITNNVPLTQVNATYGKPSEAKIIFHSAMPDYPQVSGHPNFRKASMERRNQPTKINYRPKANNDRNFEQSRMRGLQVKQPFTGPAGENAIEFQFPEMDYSDLVFSFAAKDEGAAEKLVIDYSIAAGEPQWTNEFLNESEFSLTESYRLFEIDLNEIVEVRNNAFFKIRIRFDGPDMAADLGHRVTFNNFSMDGKYCDYHQVNSVANNTGKILPAGWNALNRCDEMTYKLEPEENHVLYDVLVNGQSVMDSVRIDSTGIGQFILKGIDRYSHVQARFSYDREKLETGGNIPLYPNPAQDVFYVATLSHVSRLQLFSASGSKVRDLTISESLIEIDVSDLQPGIYIVRMDTDDGELVRKIVIIGQ